jgi:hypothetical protein
MDKLYLPKFTPDMLKRVKDHDMKTPGEGLMTLNESFWGPDPETSQLQCIRKFDTMQKIKNAVDIGNHVCLGIVSGVVNHMAPAGVSSQTFSMATVNTATNTRPGQRMTEIANITMLEQEVPLKYSPSLYGSPSINFTTPSVCWSVCWSACK